MPFQLHATQQIVVASGQCVILHTNEMKIKLAVSTYPLQHKKTHICANTTTDSMASHCNHWHCSSRDEFRGKSVAFNKPFREIPEQLVYRSSLTQCLDLASSYAAACCEGRSNSIADDRASRRECQNVVISCFHMATYCVTTFQHSRNKNDTGCRKAIILFRAL